MGPKELLNTVYLGDRSCKKIEIDGWKRRVLFQVDTISRIRSASGKWEYYTDEDIADGYIVFTGVDSIKFNPPGYIPNDYIEVKSVLLEDTEEYRNRPHYIFGISVGSVDEQGNSHDILIEIIAEGVHLEDPVHPGTEILE